MTHEHDIRNQQIIRDRLQSDVDAFLARGGKVETLPAFAGSPKQDDEDDATVMTAVPFGRNYRDL